MGKDCCLGFGIVTGCLVFLVYLIIAVFVVPINCQCQNNSSIPENPSVDITMDQWIFGGLGGGIVIFSMIGGCAKNKSNGDCWIGALAGTILLYILFVFVWSIIGMALYNSYYGQACQSVEAYSLYMNLGIYFGLAFSSSVILTIIIAIIIKCTESCCEKSYERRPLLAERPPELPVAPARIARNAPVVARVDADAAVAMNQPNDIQYAKIVPQRQEEVIITDAQFQQNRNIYEHIYNRLSRNSRPRSQRFG